MPLAPKILFLPIIEFIIPVIKEVKTIIFKRVILPYFSSIIGPINKIYKNLPIKSMKDIDITGKEVMTLLNLEPSKKVSEIINDVKIEILKKNLKKVHLI